MKIKNNKIDLKLNRCPFCNDRLANFSSSSYLIDFNCLNNDCCRQFDFKAQIFSDQVILRFYLGKFVIETFIFNKRSNKTIIYQDSVYSDKEKFYIEEIIPWDFNNPDNCLNQLKALLTF